jgi:hypothetical protein
MERTYEWQRANENNIHFTPLSPQKQGGNQQAKFSFIGSFAVV